MSISRFVLAALAGAALSIAPAAALAQMAGHAAASAQTAGPAMLRNHGMAGMHHAAAHAVTVYKSPECECCGRWIEHLRAAGFTVKVVEVPDVTPTKDRYGVPAALRTCHTALVGGYVIEGHVPADVIEKLLTEHPANVAGIAVPGMPMGSPGMEMQGMKEHYQVVAFDKQGHTHVYAQR